MEEEVKRGQCAIRQVACRSVEWFRGEVAYYLDQSNTYGGESSTTPVDNL